MFFSAPVWMKNLSRQHLVARAHEAQKLKRAGFRVNFEFLQYTLLPLM